MSERKWIDWVAENIGVLVTSIDYEDRLLIAIFDLVIEWEAGGLTAYLMNDAGNGFGVLVGYAEKQPAEELRSWVKSIENIYGGSVSENRDARIDVISQLAGYEDGEDPFEDPHNCFGSVLPCLSDIAEKLIAGRL